MYNPRDMTSFLTTPIHPYAYDGLALLLILFFLWRGWRRGLVRELSSVISIGGSILLAKPLGNLLLKIPGIALPEFLTSIVGPAIGGIAAYILLRFSCFVIAKSTGLLKKREEGEEVTTKQSLLKAGGGLIGALFGLLMVLVLGWYTLSFGQLSALLLGNPALSAPSIAENGSAGASPQDKVGLLLLPARITAAHRENFSLSFTGQMAAGTNPVPENILQSAEMVVGITQHPEQLQKLAEFAPVQALAEEPSVKALTTNAEVKALAEAGDIAGLLNHPDVQALLNDPKIQEILKGMDPEEVRKFLEENK